jgi:hypothetical protein
LSGAPEGAPVGEHPRIVVVTPPGATFGAPAEVTPFVALAKRYGLAPSELDGWQVAANFTRSDCRIADAGLRRYAERLAAAAVLRRAADLVGPLRGGTRLVAEPLREPHLGDLDVERTFENVLGKPYPERDDWVVTRREERRVQVVLMVDTSLSMSGENMAIAAVAAAALALKLHRGDLSVVVFEDRARAVSRLEEEMPAREIVRRMLEQPVRGYTNIEAGLLITDGVSTVGGDPVPPASRFNRLFVLLTEDYKMNPELCRRMADAGGGDVFPVASYRELPRRIVEVADRVLR